MPNLPILSFNKGKLTRLIDLRSDVDAYTGGCRIAQNVLPLIYGPVTRRPGTKFIANVANNSKKSRLVPFIFSSTIAYKLEFADKIINVYFGDTIVDANIVTPYLEADLFQLQFDQSADVRWVVHPSHAQREFNRVSASEFTLNTITFDKGPFIKRNDIANDDGVTITVTTTQTVIATATLGAAENGIFTIESATDISSLFPLNKRFYVTGSTGNDKAYTVFTATYAGTTLTIKPNEAVATSDNDGQIFVDGGEVTLTSSSAVFTTGSSGHTDALFKLTHNRLQVLTKGSQTGTNTGIIGEPIDVKGSWTAITGGNWDGTLEVQRLEDRTNWETFTPFVSTLTGKQGSANLQKVDIEEANGVQFRLFVTDHPVSSTIDAHFKVNNSTQDSIYRITATASTTSVTATAVVAAPDNVAVNRWAEGSWSNVRGFPAAVAFFGERIIYGFSTDDAQNIWLSQIGEFEDFEAGINDSDSFALFLPTAERGRWLGSLETLAAGTTGGEWQIRATTLEQALTPKNFDMKEQTTRGSANIQAVEVNETILFVDSVARKIREFTFSDSDQKYLSPDLTALAEDITDGGITSLAVQKNPDSIIWFTIANSPYLISMTYEREQNVVAFAQHPLGGDGIAESVIVTPSTEEDIITLTVKRTINGSTVRFIEEMQPRDFGSTTDATNSFFVDAGIVDTSGSTTITNLGHLEGKEVAVLVDGAVQASKTVLGAQITIDEAGARVVVGLPIEWKVSPMRPDVTTATGTTHGSIMIVPEIVLSLFASGGVEYGDGTNQKPIDFRTTENFDSPPELFTGDTDALVIDGGFTKDVDIVISGSTPLPATVRGIILRTQKTGR